MDQTEHQETEQQERAEAIVEALSASEERDEVEEDLDTEALAQRFEESVHKAQQEERRQG